MPTLPDPPVYSDTVSNGEGIVDDSDGLGETISASAAGSGDTTE